MKLVLLALVGLVAAEVSLEQLAGDALIEYVNRVQNQWKAGAAKDYSAALMDVKYTKHPEGTFVKPSLLTEEQLAAIPDSFDARAQWPGCPNIGAIRDQANCGSCWAFAATEAQSDRTCIASNGTVQVTLAANDPLACCGYRCGYGCEGGYPIRAWNYWVSTGVVTGSGFYENQGCMPYPIEPCGTHVYNNHTYHHTCSGEVATPACPKSCQSNYNVALPQDKHFGRSSYAVARTVTAIQTEILTNGPVEAAFSVYRDFYNYKGGVYHHTTGGLLGGHAVKILGWGTENGTPYWLVANSWGNDWGEKGFFRIQRGNNECGIEEGIVAGLAKV